MNPTPAPSDQLSVRVGFDGTPLAARAAAWAHRLAQLTGADVELVEVPPAMSASAVLAEECQHADLMVVGTHGHVGPIAGLLGSTSRSLALTADCPVALVNETADPEVHRCVAVWDGAADDDELVLLRWALDFARRTRLPLHVITPWQSRTAVRVLASERPSLEQAERHHAVAAHYLREHAAGVLWTGSTIEGTAASVVAEHTYDHDVVAILRDGPVHVQSVVDKAPGLVVVVPTGVRLRGDERPSREDLPVV